MHLEIHNYDSVLRGWDTGDHIDACANMWNYANTACAFICYWGGVPYIPI